MLRLLKVIWPNIPLIVSLFREKIKPACSYIESVSLYEM